MIDEVKVCVDAKINFLNESFTIPNHLQSTVDTFTQDVINLGEECKDATEFESKFVSSGLSDQFMKILPQCPQKTKKMTKEEKKESINTAKKIISEEKGYVSDYVAKSVADRAQLAIEDEVLTSNREKMIEDGTFDDYAITSNAINDIGVLGRFFGKKKKKK